VQYRVLTVGGDCRPRKEVQTGGCFAMLNDRAREILSFIQLYSKEKGYPPTIREIGHAFHISSTNGVRYYLDLLERAGSLKRLPGISRGIGNLVQAARAGIPILGRVTAGPNGVAEQSFEGTLDPDGMFGSGSSLFALRVRGDSMRDAGILAGDYVIVQPQKQAQNGQIVVARIGEEATVKTFQSREGQVELVPSNPDHRTIEIGEGDDFEILGLVRGVLRTVGR
jgi:repressor LexA